MVSSRLPDAVSGALGGLRRASALSSVLELLEAARSCPNRPRVDGRSGRSGSQPLVVWRFLRSGSGELSDVL
eukprot:637310-Alexandrium_andersonii.AAC.1